MALFELGNYHFVGASDTKFVKTLDFSFTTPPQCSPELSPAVNPKVLYPLGYNGATIDTIEVTMTSSGFEVIAEFAKMLPTGTFVQLRAQMSSE